MSLCPACVLCPTGRRCGDCEPPALALIGVVGHNPAQGSHEVWYNPETHRRVTVPHHPGDLPMGTLRAIIREAGLTVDEFLSLPDTGNG